MTIPEWIISSFDVEIERANLETFLKEEFIEITFDLGAESMHTFKGTGYYSMDTLPPHLKKQKTKTKKQ